MSSAEPTLLQSVDLTTGLRGITILDQPITDMTAANMGASQVAEPSTVLLLVTSLAGLIGIGRWRRYDGVASPDLP